MSLATAEQVVTRTAVDEALDGPIDVTSRSDLGPEDVAMIALGAAPFSIRPTTPEPRHHFGDVIRPALGPEELLCHGRTGAAPG